MEPASLGELEKQVMDILWGQDDCTIRNVAIKLEKKGKPAYTTVATILQRLHKKGMVKRHKNNKGYYVYSPKLTKASYSKKIAQSFIKKFVSSFGDEAVVSFAESIDTLPPKKREQLLQLLENHEESK